MAKLIRVNDVCEPLVGQENIAGILKELARTGILKELARTGILKELARIGSRDGTEDGPLTLDQIQKAVGGNFEVLQTVVKDMVICCDEEGCLKNKRLNVVASRLVDAPVVGDCLLVFAQDGEMY